MDNETSAEHWFLGPDVTGRAPSYTSGNLVRPLIDGASYMADLEHRMSTMGPNDYFFFCGWRVTPEQQLVDSGRSFLEQVISLVSRGVSVRALVWRTPAPLPMSVLRASHARENLMFVRRIQRLGDTNGIAVLDGRLPAGGRSSHHQKSIVLQSNGDEIAYVGGIDICSRRRDTPAHERQTVSNSAGWHDIQCALTGPAVPQIWDNFAERWNDPTTVKGMNPLRRSTPLATIDLANRPLSQPASGGTIHVQVLRTLASDTYSFAQKGENTIELAYAKAIDRARHYVYIEDQYVWPCKVLDNLQRAAARGVAIIILANHKPFGRLLGRYHNALRQQAIEQISVGHPERVFVYHLERPSDGRDISVHSKLMIVDDRYAVVGSANLNNRSHTTDTELSVALVDDATEPSRIKGNDERVCMFVKQLRVSLWREHLGLADDTLIDDPIDARTGQPAGWPMDQSRVHRAVAHHVPMSRWSTPRWLPDRFMNPQTPH